MSKKKLKSRFNKSNLSSGSVNSIDYGCEERTKNEFESNQATIIENKNLPNDRMTVQYFETFLNNLIRQLLNSLKVQETIRLECLKLSKNDGSEIHEASFFFF